jgi:hypothetical protein
LSIEGFRARVIEVGGVSGRGRWGGFAASSAVAVGKSGTLALTAVLLLVLLPLLPLPLLLVILLLLMGDDNWG